MGTVFRLTERLLGVGQCPTSLDEFLRRVDGLNGHGRNFTTLMVDSAIGFEMHDPPHGRPGVDVTYDYGVCYRAVEWQQSVGQGRVGTHISFVEYPDLGDVTLSHLPTIPQLPTWPPQAADCVLKEFQRELSEARLCAYILQQVSALCARGYAAEVGPMAEPQQTFPFHMFDPIPVG